MSDDFSSPTLDTGLWTHVDPLGDGGLAMTGIQLELSVPAGVAHRFVRGGPSTISRILQPANDTDFEVEAKFESALTAAYQTQGIVVQQDPTHSLRFEFYGDGNGVFAYAASYLGNSAIGRIRIAVPNVLPLHMRVGRSGDDWTFSYSDDGASWNIVGSFTAVLAVTAVGPYVGNEGSSPPAATALVDYFFNTASPIVPEDGGAHTLSVASFGFGSIDVVPDQEQYADGQIVTLTATGSSQWFLSSWAGDYVGNENPLVLTMQSDMSIVGLFRLFLTNIAAAPAEGSATITWNSLLPSTSVVEYGLTTDYELGTIFEGTGTTSHSVVVPSLLSNTEYHYRVSSAVTDGSGRLSFSNDMTFTTLANTTPVSDDFSSGSLNTDLWTFVDPLGDGQINSTAATIEISVPGGSTHAVGGTGVLVPRIVQPLNDGNLDFELKFQSGVDRRYEMQGVVVEQDPANFLRLEFFSDGNSSILYGARHTNGSGTSLFNEQIPSSAPMYMRVVRMGDDWIVYHSTDGATWVLGGAFQSAIVPATVGLYAGNDGSDPPAHTAKIDYFFNSNSPIVPEDGGLHTLDVEIVGNGTVQRSPDQELYSPTDTVTLTAVPDPTAAFVGWSGGITETANPTNVVVSDDLTVTATFEDIGLTGVLVTQANDEATISWSTNLPTTGWVDWGDTPMYPFGAVYSNTLGLDHEVVLPGIVAGQLYHYQITIVNETGSPIPTGDRTFRGNEPSNLISDDFNAPALNPAWTPVDPLGDGDIQMIGARVAISVPQGTSHDLWLDGILPPHVLQASNDTDFEVEVKFESSVNERYQTQGILVKQDETNFLRYEFHHNGTSMRLFTAAVHDGDFTIWHHETIPNSVPQYIRLRREGNDWSFSYSFDEQSWTETQTRTWPFFLAAIGPYAGNVDGPAHTGVVDYFVNTAEPLADEDNGQRTITVTQVGQGQTQFTPDQPTYEDGDLVLFTALPDPMWKFTCWSRDVTGADNPKPVVVAGDLVVTANYVRMIDNISVTATETEATLTWTTAEPATSLVRYGLTETYELGVVVAETVPTTFHSVTLQNLQGNGTWYNYEIDVDDMSGTETLSGNQMFRTFLPSSIVSDDFHTTKLNSALWTVHDPVGDAQLTMTGAQVRIDLPAGTNHAVGGGQNRATRIMQPSNDADFTIEVKFETGVFDRYQIQGIIVEESPTDFLRLEFFHDGDDAFAYGSHFVNFQETNTILQAIEVGAPMYMRVQRSGDNWTLRHSSDGTNWSVAGSFVHPMVVTAVGPYAANIDAPHSVLIDYFFNTASPIELEDNGELTLTVNVQGQGNVNVDPQSTTYVPGTVVQLSATETHPHWEFDTWTGSITETSPSTSVTMDGDKVITAVFLQDRSTFFDIWYGNVQPFGQVGVPQTYVNVLGNVEDADGISSLTFQLNGDGQDRFLAIGPYRRNHLAGDFDVEIPFSELHPGLNEVVIKAIDEIGSTTEHTMDIDHSPGNVWPGNYSIDWSNVNNIQDVIQVVDGDWEITPDGIRTDVVGYDRLLDVGDMTWTDYEITVPMTVHFQSDPLIYEQNPAAGIILRWTGHTDNPIQTPQPHTGWRPHGSAVWWHFWDDNGGVAADIGGGSLTTHNPRNLDYDVTYDIKMRVETFPGDQYRYSYKVWAQDTEIEPAEWRWQGFFGGFQGDMAQGSALLIANAADVTFGDIRIFALPDGDAPTAPTGLSAETISSSRIDLTWNPATDNTQVTGYQVYRDGQPVFLTNVTSFSDTGLSPGTSYTYTVTALDGSDNESAPSAGASASTSL